MNVSFDSNIEELGVELFHSRVEVKALKVRLVDDSVGDEREVKYNIITEMLPNCNNKIELIYFYIKKVLIPHQHLYLYVPNLRSDNPDRLSYKKVCKHFGLQLLEGPSWKTDHYLHDDSFSSDHNNSVIKIPKELGYTLYHDVFVESLKKIAELDIPLTNSIWIFAHDVCTVKALLKVLPFHKFMVVSVEGTLNESQFTKEEWARIDGSHRDQYQNRIKAFHWKPSMTDDGLESLPYWEHTDKKIWKFIADYGNSEDYVYNMTSQ